MAPTKPFSPPKVYEFRSRFRAPISFVYAWCTDYSPEDPRLEEEEFTRRILERTRRRVTYEDLYDEPTGWRWSRYVVSLRPPRRWHADVVGSHRTWSIDYVLSERPGDATELHFRGVRRSTALAGKNPPKAELENELREMWRKFGRALERDFRASPKKTSRRRTR